MMFHTHLLITVYWWPLTLSGPHYLQYLKDQGGEVGWSYRYNAVKMFSVKGIDKYYIYYIDIISAYIEPA